MTNFTLKNGKEIPSLGFGTWELTGDDARRSVELALEVGYRHIDTAQIYGNQKEVGASINTSGIERDEIFLTSKVWRSDLAKEDVSPAINRILEELATDYVDLILIHWPDRNVPIADTLGEMTKAQESGLVKSVGVSNFTINHLKDASNAGFDVVNNQVEFHPSLYQKDLLEYCNSEGIKLTAYSPIAQGADLKIQKIRDLAEKYDASEAQVILNWIRQKGVISIPRSSKENHIKDNFKSLDWELETEDAKILDNINSENRVVVPGFGDFDY